MGGFDQLHRRGKHSSGINLKRRDLDRWPLIKAISEICWKKTKLLEGINDGTVILNQMPGLNNHAWHESSKARPPCCTNVGFPLISKRKPGGPKLPKTNAIQNTTVASQTPFTAHVAAIAAIATAATGAPNPRQWHARFHITQYTMVTFHIHLPGFKGIIRNMRALISLRSASILGGTPGECHKGSSVGNASRTDLPARTPASGK